MDPRDLRREVQDEIQRIFADSDLRAAKLLDAIGELGTRFDIEPFRACLSALAPVDRSDRVSRTLLEDIEAHRSWLQARLGRDAGLSVAALHFLHEIEGSIAEPVFREPDAESPAASKPPGLDAVQAPLEDVLLLEMRRAERFGRPLALVLLAPDGACAEESRLASAWGTLRETTRDTDHVARLMPGGFGLVLPCAGEREALNAAERLRKSLEGATGITWSAGAAACPDRPWNPEALADAARQALVSAGVAGGNGVRAYRPERREHPRHPVGSAIAAALLAEGPEDPIAILDLSVGGALVATGRSLDPGSRVRLVLRETAARPRELRLTSLVVRSAAVRAESADGPSWRSGIAFLADAADRCRLAGLLAGVGDDRPGDGAPRP